MGVDCTLHVFRQRGLTWAKLDLDRDYDLHKILQLNLKKYGFLNKDWHVSGYYQDEYKRFVDDSYGNPIQFIEPSHLVKHIDLKELSPTNVKIIMFLSNLEQNYVAVEWH